MKIIKLHPSWPEYHKRKKEINAEFRAKGVSEASLEEMWSLSKKYTGSRQADQYYREIGRYAAAQVWQQDPALSTFEVCRIVSQWLYDTYNVNYDYKQSVFRWINDLNPQKNPAL